MHRNDRAQSKQPRATGPTPGVQESAASRSPHAAPALVAIARLLARQAAAEALAMPPTPPVTAEEPLA